MDRTPQLHTARGPGLIDVCKLVQGFLECISGLRFTANGLAVMAK